MTKKFSDLRGKMSHESILRSQVMANQLLIEMPLHQLKQARELSQQMLAQVLNVPQPSIKKLEECADMYLSYLRRQIEEMGGELEITVRFPHGTVKVNHFSDLAHNRESDL